MNCPYCNEKMRRGVLYAPHLDTAVFWLPDEVDLANYTFSLKSVKSLVEENNGVILDEVSRLLCVSKAKPYSYYCDKCRLFITKLPEQAGE